MSLNTKAKLSPPPQHPLPPHVLPTHCNVPQLHQTLPHPANVYPLHYASLSPQTGPLAPVVIMTMTSTETTPSAVKEVAKTEHITSLLWILLELYLLFLHKPTTYFLTHPWQSNNCSTSAPTPQHALSLSTFRSLPIPQPATTAYTPLLGQTSTSSDPRLHPRPTNLKTFSTQSLPMQKTKSTP